MWPGRVAPKRRAVARGRRIVEGAVAREEAHRGRGRGPEGPRRPRGEAENKAGLEEDAGGEEKAARRRGRRRVGSRPGRGNERPMAPIATPPPRGGLLVIQPLKQRRCVECRSGPLALLVLEEGESRCLDCADLGHLVFLPRGDTALTRRSREGSTLSAVVVRYNRRRSRYERQGVLVEEGRSPGPRSGAWRTRRRDGGAGRGTRGGGRRRTCGSRRRSHGRYAVFFPAVPPTGRTRSPRTPRCAGAGGWGAVPRAVRCPRPR